MFLSIDWKLRLFELVHRVIKTLASIFYKERRL